MNQPEARIKRSILQELSYDRNAFVFPVRTIGTWSKKADRFIPCQKRGISDILGSYKGRPLAIECKTEQGYRVAVIEAREKEGVC